MSEEQKSYLRKYRYNKILILSIQIFIIIFLVCLWEFLSVNNIINSFIFSSPSKVIDTIYKLYLSDSLFHHIRVTVYETLIAFIIGLVLSIGISILLYLSNRLYKVLDPFLTCLYS